MPLVTRILHSKPLNLYIFQGTYLTSAAFSQAKDNNLHEGQVVGRFNGEFWGAFASTQVRTSRAIGDVNVTRLHNEQ